MQQTITVKLQILVKPSDKQIMHKKEISGLLNQYFVDKIVMERYPQL